MGSSKPNEMAYNLVPITVGCGIALYTPFHGIYKYRLFQEPQEDLKLKQGPRPFG